MAKHKGLIESGKTAAQVYFEQYQLPDPETISLAVEEN
jgi:hypothetical protein